MTGTADLTEPTTFRGLPAAGFAFPGPLRDRLTSLVLDGTKIATAGLVADYVVEGGVIPRAGDREAILDSALRPVAILETTRCEIATISTVSDQFARDEGEGFADAGDWRIAHERFWNSYLDELRRGLGDPTFSLTDSTPVVCQWFTVVERLEPDAAGRPAMPRTVPDIAGVVPGSTPFSQVVEANGFVFLAGQVGDRPDAPGAAPGGIEAETRAMLDNVRRLLEAVGLGLADVVKSTVYLRDFDDFAAMNAVYREYFPTDPPTRATVGVTALAADFRVEIEVVAAR